MKSEPLSYWARQLVNINLIRENMEKRAYLEDGQEVVVLSQMKNKYVVQSILIEEEIDEEYLGHEFIVNQIFDTAPIKKYEEEVKKVIDSIDELNQQRSGTMVDIAAKRLIKDEICKTLESAEKKHRDFSLLISYLDGKELFFVFQDYEAVKIMSTKEEALKDDDDNDRFVFQFKFRKAGEEKYKILLAGLGHWNDSSQIIFISENKDECTALVRKMVLSNINEEQDWRSTQDTISTIEYNKLSGFEEYVEKDRNQTRKKEVDLLEKEINKLVAERDNLNK